MRLSLIPLLHRGHGCPDQQLAVMKVLPSWGRCTRVAISPWSVDEAGLKPSLAPSVQGRRTSETARRRFEISQYGYFRQQDCLCHRSHALSQVSRALAVGRAGQKDVPGAERTAVAHCWSVTVSRYIQPAVALDQYATSAGSLKLAQNMRFLGATSRTSNTSTFPSSTLPASIL